LSSGLVNSANFVADALRKKGFSVKVVHAIDNNCIDRLVTEYKPTHVVIEAFWVVPEKFEILHKLHPKVQWIIRNHSEMPFLATEGMAMDWISRYVGYDNVSVSGNSKRSYHDIKTIVKSAHPYWDESKIDKKVLYLPNCYPMEFYEPYVRFRDRENEIHIMCFGAVRHLKNHLTQAIAAIEFADKNQLTLYFHINGTRIENKSEPALNNLRGLFKNSYRHHLVTHEWLSHDDFLEFIKDMDMGMQVSFTETFNIVSADMVMSELPIVVSPEVSWVSNFAKADPTSTKDIVKVMNRVWFLRNFRIIQLLNLIKLRFYVKKSIKVWVRQFSSH
jgi:glycosyltransferase involved in cell wall biosynthesis